MNFFKLMVYNADLKDCDRLLIIHKINPEIFFFEKYVKIMVSSFLLRTCFQCDCMYVCVCVGPKPTRSYFVLKMYLQSSIDLKINQSATAEN